MALIQASRPGDVRRLRLGKPLLYGVAEILRGDAARLEELDGRAVLHLADGVMAQLPGLDLSGGYDSARVLAESLCG